MTTIEPAQFAEKSVTIHDPSQPLYIEGYHRPDYRDADDAVYDAIADITSNGADRTPVSKPGTGSAHCGAGAGCERVSG